MAEPEPYSVAMKSSVIGESSFSTAKNPSYFSARQESGQFVKSETNLYSEVSPLSSAPKSEVSKGVISQKKVNTEKYNAIAATTLVVILLVVISVFCAFTWLEISKLKTPSLTSGPHTNSSQIEPALSQLNSSLQQALERFLAHANESLLDLDKLEKELNVSMEALVRQLLQNSDNVTQELRQQLIGLQSQAAQIITGLEGQYSTFSVLSCSALPPSSSSGYYWVTNLTGSAVRVYCDMTRSCGGVTGGWMRVFKLDMTNSSQQCPSGLRQRNDGNLRTCSHNTDAPGCSQVILPTSRLQYSRVCGRIKGYQVGSPDSIANAAAGARIDQSYVDGVSLTHGHPQQHIWTFAAGLDEIASLPQYNCLCTNTQRQTGIGAPPSFLENEYFCDTGSSGRFVNGFFYRDDPLWDGAGCGPLNTCCSLNTPPWFYKQLPQSTTDDIEMRVCRDEPIQNEDIAIEMVEVYVR